MRWSLQMREGKESPGKTHPVETVMKELEEMGLTWGKVESKLRKGVHVKV